jgi:hypothetical protein
MISRRAFLAFPGLVVAGCSEREQRLSAIGPADLVEVDAESFVAVPILSADSEESPSVPARCDRCRPTHVRDIRNPSAIAALIAFVNERLDGWKPPPLGLSEAVPSVSTFFLKDGRMIGKFGLVGGLEFGPNSFFWRDNGLMRRTTAADILSFRTLAHIA